MPPIPTSRRRLPTRGRQSQRCSRFRWTLPEIDGGLGLSANKQSANRPLRSATQPTYYGNNQLYAYGRLLRAQRLEPGGGHRQGGRGQRCSDRLCVRGRASRLHAELARDYVDLRGFDAQAKLLADTITIYSSALNLTRERLKAKIAPPIDEQRALTQLSDAQAQASDLALRRTALVDAIANPNWRRRRTVQARAVSSFDAVFPRRPRAAPGDVLGRRPDIAAAERDAYGASEYIGVATAAFLSTVHNRAHRRHQRHLPSSVRPDQYFLHRRAVGLRAHLRFRAAPG